MNPNCQRQFLCYAKPTLLSQWTLTSSLINGGSTSKASATKKEYIEYSFFIITNPRPCTAEDAHRFANERGFKTKASAKKELFEFLFFTLKIGLEPKFPKAISLLRKADPAFAVDARRLANERGFKTKASATKKEYILFFILV